MPEVEPVSKQEVLDFNFLSQEVEIADTRVEEAKLVYQGLADQLRQAERDFHKAQFGRQETIDLWLNQLPQANPFYAASYYFGIIDRTSHERLRPLHERGVDLAWLAETLRTTNQPVMAISLDTSEITYRTDGYAQGEGPKKPFVTFDVVAGLTSSREPLELRRDIGVDIDTGEETSTLASLELNMTDVTKIISSTSGWSYPYGEETWFGEPRVIAAEEHTLTLLDNSEFKRRAVGQLLLKKDGETAFSAHRIVSDPGPRNAYDIYVGQEAVKTGWSEQIMRLERKDYDKAAAQQVENTLVELGVDFEATLLNQ